MKISYDSKDPGFSRIKSSVQNTKYYPLREILERKKDGQVIFNISGLKTGYVLKTEGSVASVSDRTGFYIANKGILSGKQRLLVIVRSDLQKPMGYFKSKNSSLNIARWIQQISFEMTEYGIREKIDRDLFYLTHF